MVSYKTLPGTSSVIHMDPKSILQNFDCFYFKTIRNRLLRKGELEVNICKLIFKQTLPKIRIIILFGGVKLHHNVVKGIHIRVY